MGLDAVEILMGWEKTFGISIANEEAMALRTPSQAIDLIAAKLGTYHGAQPTCLSLRAFHRLRCAITTAASIGRKKVRPDARLRTLVNLEGRRTWDAVRSSCGISSLPGLGWFTPRTAGDLTWWIVIHAAKELKRPGEPWTRMEIRSVVRAVVVDVTCIENFQDDHDFIHDLGIN